MKIVFVSNYFNHHQKPFCDAMYMACGSDFLFIETQNMPEFRKKLGYEQEQTLPPYVLPMKHMSLIFPQAVNAINEADVIIIGAPMNELKRVAEKAGRKKILIRYSERIFKEQPGFFKLVVQAFRARRSNRCRSAYLLCAGSYVYGDYQRLGLFKNRAFKWGYFPETRIYDSVDGIIARKEKASILWAGRFLDWKHPEHCVEVAKRLVEDGYDFTFYFIGTGKKRWVGDLARSYGIRDRFVDLGALSPDRVRDKMENTQIFLLTSDRQEGWGVVLNEAMNSACAVIASDAAGSTGYLIKDGENGLVYESGNIEELYQCVKSVLDSEEKRISLSRASYETIVSQWNATEAAARFLKLLESILNNQDTNLFSNGPCSKA